MYVRFRLLLVVAIGTLGASYALSAASPDFCAVSATISQSDGSAINSTWMELVDSSGKVELRREVGAEFQICDFSFGPHTLRVGTNECFPVAVSNLEVRLGKPVKLDIRLPKCVYGREMFGSSTGERACFSYFRTSSGNGEPLSQVQIFRRFGMPESFTDSYGRWQGIMAGTKEITFSKPGYSPKTLQVTCPAVGPLEVSVLLTPQG